MTNASSTNRFRDASIATAAAVIAFALFEISLRLINPAIPGKISRFDEHRYYAMIPNARGWVIGEAAQLVTFNHEGYRDSEHVLTRPHNVKRVAVLGDSMTESMHVMLDQSFPKIMEREMARRPTGTVYEVMNFGVQGYSILQCLMTLREDVWRYDPQDIVLVLTSSEIFHGTRATYWAERPPYPFFEYRNGALVPDSLTEIHVRKPAHGAESPTDLLERSRVIYLWKLSYNRVVNKFWGGGKAEGANFVAHQYDALRPPLTPEMQESWHVSEGLLDIMRAEIQQHGARFWIIIADAAAEAHPSMAFRRQFDHEHNLPSPYYGEARIEEFARSHDIHAFRVAPDMARSAAATNTMYHFEPANGHWNIAGHKIVGKLIARELTLDPY